jgi:hypothetical protein
MKSIIGVPACPWKDGGAGVVVLAALSLVGVACGGSLTPSPDAADAPAPAPAIDGGVDTAAVCLLGFDPGPCRAAIPVHAFVNGACVPQTYGGCEGNDNRFESLEECMATCVGEPSPGACPPNRIAREICLACGPAGGCSKMATVCALVCDADAGAETCEPSLPICYQGVCQMAFCR